MSEGEQQELQKHLQKELPRGIKKKIIYSLE